MPTGPTVTIDLAALRHNLQVLRARLSPGVRLMAAVKADAYGLGVARIARELEHSGADAFGVATAEEALALRAAAVTGPVLVMGPVRERVAELVDAAVDLTVTDAECLASIERASPSARARVHVKVDTGMGRLGHPAEDALDLVRAVERSRSCEFAALWTHLACADEADADDPRGLTALQLERFEQALEALRAAGVEAPASHAANSAATLRLPRAHRDLVRPGLALYGHHATPAAEALMPAEVPALRPIATLRAPVVFVKRVPRGASISYGATWRAPRDTVIATVRLGYADGYPRAAGNVAQASLNGELVEVVGRVCMDQSMLDLGPRADVAVGDVATFYGPGGPSLAVLAEKLGTVSYELLTNLQALRLAREYVEG